MHGKSIINGARKVSQLKPENSKEKSKRENIEEIPLHKK